jgi:hypothetical protein
LVNLPTALQSPAMELPQNDTVATTANTEILPATSVHQPPRSPTAIQPRATELPHLPIPFDMARTRRTVAVEETPSSRTTARAVFQWGNGTSAASSVTPTRLATNTLTAAERLEHVALLEGNYKFVKFVSLYV